MTRCLDEAMLQTYFDGELSGEMMESTTLHLASCSTCAAAAREMEEEINLMMTALAPEFEASVPTERLRQRIDAAVLDSRIEAASSRDRAGIGAFISSLLTFGSNRALAYASLVVLLTVAGIFGLVKLTTTTPPPRESVAQQTPKVVEPTVSNPASGEIAQVPASGSEQSKNANSVKKPVRVAEPIRVANKTNITPKTNSTPDVVTVKLLPGERAYLQTIAKLDSTIKANKKAMRPSLQVEYERNLAVVDRAIAATRSAVKNNPNDTDATDFMFAAYQSKVDLLNTIADARLGAGRSH